MKSALTFKDIVFKSYADHPDLYHGDQGVLLRIAYKNRKFWWQRLFERNKYVLYQPGLIYNGENEFVRETFRALEYVKAGTFFKIVSAVNDSKRVVLIKKGRVGDDQFLKKRRIILYHPQSGIRLFDNAIDSKGKPECNLTGERQSSALGLFHELGHAYVNIYLSEQEKEILLKKDRWYAVKEERFVIEQIESVAAKALGEGLRFNNYGENLLTKDVLSVKKARPMRASVGFYWFEKKKCNTMLHSSIK